MDVVSPILQIAGACSVINKLIDAVPNFVRDQYYWKTDLQEELQSIKRLIPQIQAVVDFAEPRLSMYESSDRVLIQWMWQFRDGIEEAEEVLDELEYLELEKKANSDKNWLSRTVDASVKAAKRFLKLDDLFLERLRMCVKNLNTSASDVEKFRALVTQTSGIGTGQMQHEILPLADQSRITSSLPRLSFKGREEEKGKIIQYLLGEESEIQMSENVNCLPLVAMGGMGKTALAQQVFDHFENVNKEHFDFKIWVCDSLPDLNASTLMEKILEHSIGRSWPLEQLPVKLKEKLYSKKFLLVIDDAWDDKNQTEWEKLCDPLLYGQKGSWILLTTRMKSVAKMVSKVIRGTREPMMLPGLSKDECRSLLYEHAFVGQDPNRFSQLKEIGEEIIKKLDGVPLLAKLIGGTLNNKLEVHHWLSISKSEVWTMPQDLDRYEFIPSLTLSYMMLPPPLKRCFSYCGIFPQDYRFEKPKLVGMWMAAGLIYSEGSEEGSDEDITNCYFDILCNKSFFDVQQSPFWQSTKFYNTGTNYYTMHDMVNGLARHVSRYECCRIVQGAPSRIVDYNAIRHISIVNCTHAQLHDLTKIVCRLKHLRTLWIQYEGDHQQFDGFIRDACQSPRRIRVLIIVPAEITGDGQACEPSISIMKSDLSNQCLKSISGFVKIRFLEIPDCFVPSVSMGKFYFLQVLIGDRYHDYSLAKEANKLTNLRHLYRVNDEALCPVAKVGKLTSLQKLCFAVGTEPGYRINELTNMDNLRKLIIRQLSNVQSREEVNIVKLVRKSSLISLELDWTEISNSDDESNPDGVSNPDLEQEVLGALQPPPTIRELIIRGYKGGRPAEWMNTSLSELESIELYACTSLEEMPPLWKLPCLKCLKLNQMKAIRSLGHDFSDHMGIQFPVLEELEFRDLPLWEEWNGADDYIWFPHLKSFEIENCPKLNKMPYLPLSTENLCIENLKLDSLGRCLQGLTSLKKLKVSDCQHLVSLPNIEYLHNLTVLQTLHISNCKELCELESLTALASLRELEIMTCPKLCATTFSILQKSATITEQSATKIKKGTLPSLEKIEIDSFFYLPSLPIPERLNTLTISSSDIENSLLPRKFTHFPSEIEEWLLQCQESLADLDFGEMPHLQSLPESLDRFSSLESLRIRFAPELKSLPRMPASLKQLMIDGCSADLKMHCSGRDLPNISHIRYIYITEAEARDDCNGFSDWLWSSDPKYVIPTAGADHSSKGQDHSSKGDLKS